MNSLLGHARDQRGMTLVEMLVATTLGLVVMGSALTFAVSSQRSQRDTGGRADALVAERVALERISRDLRQAETVNVVSPSVIDMQIPAPATTALRPVRYDCSLSAECRRSQGSPGGALSGPAATILTQVQSATFTASSVEASQDYVQVDLVVSSPGRTQGAALSDGVFLRNKEG